MKNKIKKAQQWTKIHAVEIVTFTVIAGTIVLSAIVIKKTNENWLDKYSEQMEAARQRGEKFWGPEGASWIVEL